MHAHIGWILMFSAVATVSFAADGTFFADAARAGAAEVALGRLAESRGSTDAVKQFGRQMAADHEASGLKLKAAAAKSGVELPTGLTVEAQATQRQLQALTGRDFDLAYLESQRKAHAKTIGLLEKEIASGADSAAKAWAREALPTVQRHAEMIGNVGEPPGEHDVEHAAGTAGPADAPRVGETPR